MEHVMLRQVEHARQSAESIGVAFECAVCMNVLKVEASSHQVPCDQDGAMAFKRLLFGTHEGQRVVLHSFLNTLQPTPKQLSVCQAVVLDLSMLVTCRVLATRSELLAQENISDSTRTQRLF